LTISSLFFSAYAVLNFLNWNFCFLFLDWLFETELGKGAGGMADALALLIRISPLALEASQKSTCYNIAATITPADLFPNRVEEGK